MIPWGSNIELTKQSQTYPDSTLLWRNWEEDAIDHQVAERGQPNSGEVVWLTHPMASGDVQTQHHLDTLLAHSLARQQHQQSFCSLKVS